ncbi:MAG: hypothetical protein A2X35_07000 [Elusimicrobia bacterium GWA2_61_42]|nr:MAG: hypothetical protein A2X35_07000 [Elusimicrobia bacterium GWA2_61_42]OGR78373.1 MAG: hypothetical protein A2X38_05655 [Elusimicrobia bacterium GWC2_61_25]
MPWGAELETPYQAWAWISEFTEEDQDTWPGLSEDQQDSLLKKAEASCRQADKAAEAASGSDAKALEVISDATLARLAVCAENGEARAAALQQKRDKLGLILARAKAGPLPQADLAWLEENSLRLNDEELDKAAWRGQMQAQAQNSKKSLDKSGKKLAALKDSKALKAEKLSSLYDGGKTGLKGPADANSAVQLKGKAGTKLSTPSPLARGSKKALTSTAPPEVQLTEHFKGMEGYKEIKAKDQFTAVMKEVDKDGESGGKVNAAKAATLKAVFQVSKDFNETFINNPSPKDEDVRLVIDKIKSKAKNPDDAWEIALQMRKQKDFPALRDVEHYLWSCTRTTESKWHGAATIVSTPLYSLAKMPGLRKIFFDEETSPPSLSEVKWGTKGVTECWKKQK